MAIDEATGFNPSGLSDPRDEDPGREPAANDAASQSNTSISQPPSLAQITDSSSTDISSEGVYSVPKLTSFNAESEETKVLYLRGMFAELKEFDITYALKKAEGDFQGALDHLLNVQYLESTGQQAKGIEAFFNDAGETQPQKSSKKSRRKSKQKSKGNDLDFESLSKNPEKEIKRKDAIQRRTNILADVTNRPR